jgi:hypothetical protein
MMEDSSTSSKERRALTMTISTLQQLMRTDWLKNRKERQSNLKERFLIKSQGETYILLRIGISWTNKITMRLRGTRTKRWSIAVCTEVKKISKSHNRDHKRMSAISSSSRYKTNMEGSKTKEASTIRIRLATRKVIERVSHFTKVRATSSNIR